MTKRYIEFDVENLLLGFAFLAALLAYWAYLKAGSAEGAAWAAHNEIRDHRTQVEDEQFAEQFALEGEDDGDRDE